VSVALLPHGMAAAVLAGAHVLSAALLGGALLLLSRGRHRWLLIGLLAFNPTWDFVFCCCCCWRVLARHWAGCC